MVFPYLITLNSSPVKFALQLASRSREIPTREFFCSPGNVYNDFSPYRRLPMYNSQSCVIEINLFTVVPTYMGSFVVIMLQSGEASASYITFAHESEIP